MTKANFINTIPKVKLHLNIETVDLIMKQDEFEVSYFVT